MKRSLAEERAGGGDGGVLDLDAAAVQREESESDGVENGAVDGTVRSSQRTSIPSESISLGIKEPVYEVWFLIFEEDFLISLENFVYFKLDSILGVTLAAKIKIVCSGG